MFFCLRIDLDYVPWDTPDATEFGHGEPAVLLRLLDLARNTGHKFQFFVSYRSLRAFPMNADAVLNDGHDLDWLCKHPEDVEHRYEEAIKIFDELGHKPIGVAAKGAWPSRDPVPAFKEMLFMSADPGPVPEGLKLFPTETRSVRDAQRSGLTSRVWADVLKTQIREAAARNRGVTVVVRPQVLAKYDPRLQHVREMLELAQAVGITPATLREAFFNKLG